MPFCVTPFTSCVDLMSGSNDNMTRVTTVASGLDGTDSSLSPYTWTCPEVDPYSAIYFYQVRLRVYRAVHLVRAPVLTNMQLTNGANSQESSWTTRFAVRLSQLPSRPDCSHDLQITSPGGDSQPPEHTTQPAGDAVPWGEGHLASGDAVSAQDVGSDDASSSDADQGDEDGSSDLPSTSTTRTHKHDTTDALSSTRDSSLYWTANSARPTPSASGAAAEDMVPTASLPTKKAHASNSGSPSSSGPASSETSCSGMGPGVSQVGGMKLASAAPPSRGSRWLDVVPLYPVIFAMLL